MKRVLILFLVICFGISLSSFDSKKTFAKGKLLLRQIENVKSTEARKLAYTMLQPEERYLLWSARLQEMVLSRQYNSKQSEAIVGLKNALSVDVFKMTNQREVFFNVSFPKWVKENSTELSSSQIYNIAFTIEKSGNLKQQNSLATTLNFDGGEQASTCICAVGSHFTCPKYIISWPPSIEYGSCSKKANETCVITSGCGGLWDANCDGSICTW